MKGKINHLPRAIRDQVCERIYNGQTGKTVLAWLNDLAETKAVLRDLFDGANITDSNLSNFAGSSYFDQWKADVQSTEKLETLADFAARAARATDGNMSEGSVQILAGQILMSLQSGTPEDMESAAKALGHIRKAELATKSVAQRDRALNQREREIALREEAFRLKSAEALLDFSKDNAIQSIIASKDDRATKLKRMVARMFGDRPSPVGASLATPATAST
jgi:hypothetical protein